MTRDEARTRRVERSQSGPVLCEICKLPLDDINGGRKVHAGECYRERGRRRNKAKKAAEKEARTVTKLCKCGRTFRTSNGKKVRCGEKTCTNEHNRQFAKAKYDAMTEADKQEARKKKYKSDKPARSSYTSDAEWVTAKCPRCGIDHQYRFEVPYTGIVKPRKYCLICSKYVEFAGSAEVCRASFPAMREYHTI